jgi:hypothetical protein
MVILNADSLEAVATFCRKRTVHKRGPYARVNRMRRSPASISPPSRMRFLCSGGANFHVRCCGYGKGNEGVQLLRDEPDESVLQHGFDVSNCDRARIGHGRAQRRHGAGLPASATTPPPDPDHLPIRSRIGHTNFAKGQYRAGTLRVRVCPPARCILSFLQ